jgi:hypothetical protein
MENLTKPDYDSLMTFLAETPVLNLVDLAAQPAALDKYLLDKYPEKEWGNIAPDTQEAQDAATASGEVSDRAEKKIYLLLEKAPAAWEAIKESIKRVAADDGSLAFFQRYHAPDPPYHGVNDQE